MQITSGFIFLVFLTAQRLVELWWSKRNEARLKAAGGAVYESRYWPLVMILQAVWMVGMWLLAYDHAIVPVFFALFVATFALRVWVLATLGRYWTINTIVIPGSKLVTGGPYRFLRHPNYVVMACEMAVVPLTLGLPIFAVIFFVLAVLVLWIRISYENVALAAADPSSRPDGAQPSSSRL